MKFLFSTVSGPIPHTCHSAPHHPHPHTLTTATHHPQQSEPAGKKGWSPETQNVEENTILTKVCILPGRSSPSFTVVLNPSSSEGMQCYPHVHLIWQSSSRICQICNLTGTYIKRGPTNTSFFSLSLSLGKRLTSPVFCVQPLGAIQGLAKLYYISVSWKYKLVLVWSSSTISHRSHWWTPQETTSMTCTMLGTSHLVSQVVLGGCPHDYPACSIWCHSSLPRRTASSVSSPRVYSPGCSSSPTQQWGILSCLQR